MERYRWAQAYRGDERICGRVDVLIVPNHQLGVRERRCVEARFLERLNDDLRAELTELVRKRGRAARDVAERLEPIEFRYRDHRGHRRIVGRLQPPMLRFGELRDVEFPLREQ